MRSPASMAVSALPWPRAGCGVYEETVHLALGSRRPGGACRVRSPGGPRPSRCGRRGGSRHTASAPRGDATVHRADVVLLEGLGGGVPVRGRGVARGSEPARSDVSPSSSRTVTVRKWMLPSPGSVALSAQPRRCRPCSRQRSTTRRSWDGTVQAAKNAFSTARSRAGHRGRLRRPSCGSREASARLRPGRSPGGP